MVQMRAGHSHRPRPVPGISIPHVRKAPGAKYYDCFSSSRSAYLTLELSRNLLRLATEKLPPLVTGINLCHYFGRSDKYYISKDSTNREWEAIGEACA